MGSFLFSVLPLWQALILVIVFSGLVALLLTKAGVESRRREGWNLAAGNIEALGGELRRMGYEIRGKLVTAAAEMVKAAGQGRAWPALRPGAFGGEHPVDRYIRELRHPAPPAKLIVLPKKKREGPERITIMSPTLTGRS